MKKVAILKSDNLKIEPFCLDKVSHMSSLQKVSKKEIKELADRLNIEYDHTHISFAKKILNAYLEKTL